MEVTQQLLDYFRGDELAASTWLNKYAQEGEKTPDDMHRRMAKEFARIEAKYGGDEHNYCKFSEEKIYKAFKDFKYIIPGGSIMATLGKVNGSLLSNCTVLKAPYDSISGIMDTCKDMSNLFKRRCGVGFDISTLRPKGAKVNNSAKETTGACSFMDLFSFVTNLISQQGRRGALLLSMNINHPDIIEFITKKQDLTKVTGANISIQVTDEFMQAMLDDENYYLRWPVETEINPKNYIGVEYNKLIEETKDGTTIYVRKVKAKDIWDTFIQCSHRTAEPGIIFKDTMINYAPDGGYEDYRMVSTNPCQPSYATVLTKDGIKTFNDINVGDKIWSSEGWTTIVNKQCTGIKPVYEYKTHSGTFIGTENHRVISKGNKVEVKDAETIDLLGGTCDIADSLNLQDIIDGLVIGDGTYHKNSNNILLNIGSKDLDYFCSEINDFILENYSKSYTYKVNTTITSSELPNTYLRSIPNRFIYGSSAKVRGFLRGLYSANGSVVSNRVTLKTASSILRDQVILMLSSIGIRSYYTTNEAHEVEFDNGKYWCKESYDVNISTDRFKFNSLVGFIQKYKTQKLLQTTSNILDKVKTSAITDIKLIGNEEVYNVTVDNNSHTYWTGGLNVSNCGEIGMNVDTCRLLHLNLTSFVKFPYTKAACIDWENMDKYARIAVNLADDLVDLEVEYMDDLINRLDKEKSKDEIKLLNTFRNHAIAGRRTGLGFTGLADMIAMLGLKYDSTEGISVIEDIMQSLFYFELQQDIKLAEVRGEFDVYSPSNEENLWTKFLRNNYTSLYGEMIKKGRRNINFSTVAPTGTVSLMAQCTSGIEPLFKPWYIRRRKCKEGEDYDYVDVVGEKYKEFKVVHEGLKRWMSINNYPMEDLESVYKLSPYYQSCAEDIDPFARVTIQGIIQKYITHSISSTVNLPEETTPNTISDIFIQAWRAGCKGQTVYRTGSRSGVLVDSKTKKPEKMNDTNAPKRPEELEADYYEVKARGEKFIVIVGLFENRPYEIFVFRPTIDVKTANHKGKIIKKGKGKYSFISEHVEINNLLNTNISVEEKAATLYSSMLLRHGISIKYIIKTAKKVDDNITSFSSAMCRVLSKYDNSPTDEKCPECGEPLTRESSCVICKSCGYSKCI